MGFRHLVWVVLSIYRRRACSCRLRREVAAATLRGPRRRGMLMAMQIAPVRPPQQTSIPLRSHAALTDGLSPLNERSSGRLPLACPSAGFGRSPLSVLRPLPFPLPLRRQPGPHQKGCRLNRLLSACLRRSCRSDKETSLKGTFALIGFFHLMKNSEEAGPVLAGDFKTSNVIGVM